MSEERQIQLDEQATRPEARPGSNDASGSTEINIVPLRTPLKERPVLKGPSWFEETIAFWKKLPQMLNSVHYNLKTSARGDILDYEPIHLHLAPAEVQSLNQSSDGNASRVLQAESRRVENDHMLDPENFKFLLEQIPAIRTIEFSGHIDPFTNPNLLDFVTMAHKSSGAESTIYTEGTQLGAHLRRILSSPLRTLVIRLYSSKPSQAARMTGQPLSQWVNVLDNIKSLMAMRQLMKSSVEIELAFTVDIHSYRDMPEMLKFALEMGVEGVRFENYLSPQTLQKTDRTLFSNDETVMRYLEGFKNGPVAKSNLNVQLPVPLDSEMQTYRNCLDPFTTVSVDADFNISGCTRRILPHEGSGKIWDSDFWNNEMYQWLRGVHSGACGEIDASETDVDQTVPAACQSCIRNMPKTTR